MRTLGRHVVVLDQEKADLDELLEVLVAKTARELLALYGLAVHGAATLLGPRRAAARGGDIGSR